MPHPLPAWRPPVLLKASLACHLLAAALPLAVPAAWPWAVTLLVVNHAVLTAAGLWPRSHWLGQNMTRLPAAAIARREIALTIDDGPDPEVTPAVLDLLDAAGARATFFCIADRAAAHPALLQEILRRGHSVQNHTQRHSHRFSLLGPRGFEREIRTSQASFTRLTGSAPTLFRAPAGFRNPFLAPVLHRHGLALVSWTRRGFDTRERDPARVLERLTDGLAAGDILLLHDGHAARSAAGRPVVLEVLPRLLQRCAAAGLRPVTLPEALAGREPPLETIR
ncbi:polysaccharide deacetylase family protein [Aquabacterium sp. A7-Y]|uniref:polysaccharide deacetylase family protein n=1 Tax=Aquabacterium sp. A7-Y TaxID=1349605 RepID=UPI00223E6550|nr:polysaccharide deacetylase family protein [Aquabacterium sp. A7-Y]MCW7536445.1 polysaccharide deacetylase family protein [Aquabacterium sp. A7-Y]